MTELKKALDSLELKILDSILKLPQVSDIEQILKILDPIVNPNSATYLKRVIGDTKIGWNIFDVEAELDSFLHYCNKLKQTIITELFTQYEFNDSIIEKALKEYRRLFSFMESWNQLDIHIFTTDYDSIIENFCINCEC